MERLQRRRSTESDLENYPVLIPDRQESRAVSQDDMAVHPRSVPKHADVMRSRSADDIRTMDPVRWTFENLRDATIFRNRSEGDHLAVAIRRAIARREETDREIQNELYKSRSLFDSRFVSLPKFTDRLTWQQRFKIRTLWVIRMIEHYFIPLQLGIVVALIWANIDYGNYVSIWMDPHDDSFSIHFFINDIFMALFFGVAMVHVSTAMMEGGALHPLKQSLTPLLATLGGIIGPAGIYLAMVALQGNFETQSQGWAACIETDISVAWMVAVQVFGTHPAVQFLLLLAVVDDVIGLIVIAICFPTGPLHPIWILLVIGSIAVSLILRFWVKTGLWYPYIFLAGPMSWFGLHEFGVHPSLALCLVVPFIPGRANLEKFDHDCALIVHIGLFFFALCNAGVLLTQIGLATLNISVSIIFGKTIGIFLFAFLGVNFLGLSLPKGMGTVHLGLLAHISGVGLTVSLFVLELAFTDPVIRDEAKLGALLTILVAPVSIGLGRMFHAKELVVDKLLPDPSSVV